MAVYTVSWSGMTSGTALKTLVQLAASSANRVEVIEWCVSFVGTNPLATPVLVDLSRDTTAGTGGVSATAIASDPADATAKTVALTGPLAAAWGTDPPVTSTLYSGYYVPVALGPFFQYPAGRGIVLAVSGRIAILVTAAVAVTCAGHIKWIE